MTLNQLINLLTHWSLTYGDVPVLADDFRDQGETGPTPEELQITVVRQATLDVYDDAVSIGIVFGVQEWTTPEEKLMRAVFAGIVEPETDDTFDTCDRCATNDEVMPYTSHGYLCVNCQSALKGKFTVLEA